MPEILLSHVQLLASAEKREATTILAGRAATRPAAQTLPEGIVGSKNAFEFLRIFLNDSGRVRAKPSI
jgi:hypothetical protein